jgi:hypothetical protein
MANSFQSDAFQSNAFEAGLELAANGFNAEFELDPAALFIVGVTGVKLEALEFEADLSAITFLRNTNFAANAFDFKADLASVSFADGIALFADGFDVEADLSSVTASLGLSLAGLEMTAEMDEVILRRVLPFGNSFDILLQLIPAETASSARYHAERCFVDGVPLYFSDFTLTAPERRIGVDLTLTLADLSQKSLIEADGAVFTFEVQYTSGGAWYEIFSAGHLKSNEFNIEWGNFGAADGYTFTVQSNVDDSAPDAPIVIYDSARTELDGDDFEVLLDSEGNEITYTLEDSPGLSTHTLFQRLADELGYTGFKTNIPNFQVRRVDWGLTSVWIQPVAEKISPFDALIYPVGTEIWFQDATMTITEGTPAPLPLTIDKYARLSITNEKARIDGFLMDYQANENEWDEQIVRIETPPDEIVGTLGDDDYRRTAVQIYYLDYFKEDRLIKSQYEATFKQIYGAHEYSGSASRQLGSFEEQITYDSKGQQIASVTIEEELVYDGALWALAEVSRKSTGYRYAGHPYKQDSSYLKRKTEVLSGKYHTDTDNPVYTDQDFKLGYRDALRAGYSPEDSTLTDGKIYATEEAYKIETKDRVRVTGRRHDLLKGVTPVEYDEPRTGDITIDGNSTETKPMVVYPSDGYTRTGKPLRGFSIDEVPVTYGIPLARRTLDLLINKNRRAEVTIHGWILGLRRGLSKALTDRNGAAIGNFLVEGYTMTGSNLGNQGQASRTTTLNVRQI